MAAATSTLSKFQTVLKIGYFFGFFPCSSKEDFVLKPLKNWQILLKLFLTSTIIYLANVLSLWQFISQSTNEYTLWDYAWAYLKTSR